jgi:hypothetical protein
MRPGMHEEQGRGCRQCCPDDLDPEVPILLPPAASKSRAPDRPNASWGVLVDLLNVAVVANWGRRSGHCRRWFRKHRIDPARSGARHANDNSM